MTQSRMIGLDGLRGVAAVVVVLRHTLNAIPVPPDWLRNLVESPLALLLNAQGAVQLFFVLSGFVLASSLDRAWTHGTLARRLPAFLAKRTLRIHVPYLAAVVLSWLLSLAFIASTAGHGLTPWIAASTRVDVGVGGLLSTFVFPGSARGLLPQGWTLAIEMAYSLLFPLLFWIGRRSWLVLVGLSLALLYWSPSAFRGLFYAIDFSLGIALYLERDRITGWLSPRGRASSAAVWIAGLLLFASPMLLGWSVWQSEQGFYIAGFRRSEILLMGIGSTILVAVAFAIPRYSDFLAWRPLAFLGRLSFSLYLVHRAWITFLAPRIDSGSRGLDAALLYAGVLTLSLVSSVLFERFFDRPAVRAGRIVSDWINGHAVRARSAPSP